MSPSGKTGLYEVVNAKSEILLGNIKWHGPWRQYVFFPQADCLFSAGCLNDIGNSLDLLKSER